MRQTQARALRILRWPHDMLNEPGHWPDRTAPDQVARAPVALRRTTDPNSRSDVTGASKPTSSNMVPCGTLGVFVNTRYPMM